MMKSKRLRKQRLGSIAVLSAFLMVGMMGVAAMAIDLGYIVLVRTQLQTSADSAALAAVSEVLNNFPLTPQSNYNTIVSLARSDASSFAAYNKVAGSKPLLATADVTFGRFSVPFSSSNVMTTALSGNINAAKVVVRRDANINGQVPMFFGRLLGTQSVICQAQATAAFIDNFSGFTLPPNSTDTLGILPFAIDQGTWISLVNGSGGDNWGWDEAYQEVYKGSDGIPEANMFPQGTGSPGNRGTIDIGPSNNSTKDLSRQIREGINASDLEAMGGSFQLDSSGTLMVEGDTGISAGIKDDLSSIIGQTRIIPIFSYISGSGNNAQYQIVGFGGVRILDVNLTGSLSNKRVTIQPARVQVSGGIPSGGETQYSYFMYSTVQLVK
jgi:hypothetical protein